MRRHLNGHEGALPGENMGFTGTKAPSDHVAGRIGPTPQAPGRFATSSRSCTATRRVPLHLGRPGIARPCRSAPPPLPVAGAAGDAGDGPRLPTLDEFRPTTNVDADGMWAPPNIGQRLPSPAALAMQVSNGTFARVDPSEPGTFDTDQSTRTVMDTEL
jgi:hypothetical protein